MKIITLSLGELQTNCYIVSDNDANAVVIDPADECDSIISTLKLNNLKLNKILLTHGHFDHILALKQLYEYSGAEIYVHTEDAVMLTDKTMNLLQFFSPTYNFNKIERYNCINDGEVIKCGDLEFNVIATPGHTKGSVCYLCEDTIFSGDTLFKNSIGRTDFPGGSLNEILNSINRLYKLNKDYDVLSGHGEKTTLYYEKENNYYLKGNIYDDSF